MNEQMTSWKMLKELGTLSNEEGKAGFEKMINKVDEMQLQCKKENAVFDDPVNKRFKVQIDRAQKLCDKANHRGCKAIKRKDEIATKLAMDTENAAAEYFKCLQIEFYNLAVK